MMYIFLIAGAALALLARFYEPFPGDVSVILWVRSWQHPLATAAMETVSVIGKSWLLIGLAVVAVAILLVGQRRREALVAAGALVFLVLAPIFKRLVDRPRPPADLVGIDDALGGLGFPSGHAYQSLILFGLLVFLATVLIGRKWLRWSVQAFLVFLILAIGISRVYLGAHWPSDVLGAYLIAGSCLALLVRGYQSNVSAEASR